MPFMSSIFSIFTQFINAHITIYRNLTPNTTKGQKRVKKGKKGSKIGKKIVKFKKNHRNAIYEFKKGNKGSKMGPKQVQNGKKFKKLIEIPFYDYDFLYNTHKPYRIHYFNYTHVIRGH